METSAKASCPGGVLVHHVWGMYLCIKLPHATERGDRLLPYGPHGLILYLLIQRTKG